MMVRSLGPALAVALALAGCAGAPDGAGDGAGVDASDVASTADARAVARPDDSMTKRVLPGSAAPSAAEAPPVPSIMGLRDSCREANSRGRADCACIVDLADRTLDDPGRRLLERAFEVVADPSRPLVNERAELHAAAVEPGTYLKIDAFVQALRTACGEFPDGE